MRNSNVINVSIGAQRIMTLRTKKSKHTQDTDSPSTRQSQRIKMPHNSIFVLGPNTNRGWLHGVRADKRPGQEKSDEEKAFGGERISITFRQIGTFMDETEKTIWGSGAKQKIKAKAGKIVVRDSAQMEAMIYAFGKENHDTEFDWDTEYGSGFDVVNLVNGPAQLTLCRDPVANSRVQLALCEKSISYTKQAREKGSSSPKNDNAKSHIWMHGLSNSENPIFKDKDNDGKVMEGDLAIMFYLEEHYPFHSSSSEHVQQQPDRQTYISQTAQSNELLFMFRQIQVSRLGPSESTPTYRHDIERSLTPDSSLKQELDVNLQSWEARASKAHFIAGDSWTIIDCAFWPVLDYMLNQERDVIAEARYPNLIEYHRMVNGRECVRAVHESGNE